MKPARSPCFSFSCLSKTLIVLCLLGAASLVACWRESAKRDTAVSPGQIVSAPRDQGVAATPAEQRVVAGDDGAASGAKTAPRAAAVGRELDKRPAVQVEAPAAPAPTPRPDAAKTRFEEKSRAPAKVKRKLADSPKLKGDLFQASTMALSGAGIGGGGVATKGVRGQLGGHAGVAVRGRMAPMGGASQANTEEYARIKERGFVSPVDEPLSTFSIDVDTASYANMRRYLNRGQRPPVDAVRIEEMINYFSYDYPQPTSEHPFSVTTELSVAPWERSHYLLRLGLQGEQIDLRETPAFNLVFLLDVSGSMNQANKLPLLKAAFKLLVRQMRAEDHVSIVVYAGAAGLVLPPTPGSERGRILDALDGLRAGGSTAGGAGIKLAYDVAKRNFVEGGNNRVILATDGDFNVGVSSSAALERMIEKKREEGVYLTVLGFGGGNLKDSRMETLADKGNGNYAYIDGILEARKVLVSEMGGTLVTIAKDVKLQLEFNPGQVKGYRLIGYENRALAAQDFNDDKKDAGELGAGHRVTAFYEIIPAGADDAVPGVDPLSYQRQRESALSASKDWCTVKLRYKRPQEETSRLLSQRVAGEPLSLQETSPDFRFATAVVELGMLLRDSPHKGRATYEGVTARAERFIGEDPEGYRAEFVALAKAAEAITSRVTSAPSR